MHVKVIKSAKLQTSGSAFCRTDATAKLQQQIIRASFFNLMLVANAGVMLRAFPFTDVMPFTYKNILHGHSHFAFGGWIMPVLLALIMKLFPEITRLVDDKHWRYIALLLLVSAYGMLLSFPAQGYGAVSIFFSTLSVVGGYYLVVVLWKALKTLPSTTSHLFLKWGLFFLAISAIGPFATGPLIAMGKGGTPLYYNAVYFYLHFQYNGWFTFALLALLYKQIENWQVANNSKSVFKLFSWACMPSFALSLLWNQPSIIYHLIGGAAALMQVAALLFLWKDAKAFRTSHKWLQPLLLFAFAAFVFKNVLQFASAFPAVAEMAYVNRNFIIAYLHLVLLGCISVFAMATTFQHFNIRQSISIKLGLALFFTSFIATELLLAGHATGNMVGFGIPFYAELILIGSLPFPIGLFLNFYDLNRQLKTQLYLD